MLAPWKKSSDKLRQHIRKQRHCFATKVHLVRAMVFPVVIYGSDCWTIHKAEHQRTDASELWCWRIFLSKGPGLSPPNGAELEAWVMGSLPPRIKLTGLPRSLVRRKRKTGRQSPLLLFSCPAVFNSLRPRGLQHTRPPCSSLSPEICPSSCPLHWWCHPAISSSNALFSFCP